MFLVSFNGFKGYAECLDGTSGGVCSEFSSIEDDCHRQINLEGNEAQCICALYHY